MPAPYLIVPQSGVMERDLGAALARRDRDRHDRFEAARRVRDPRVFDRATTIEPGARWLA
jgi:hypothetical protein